MDGGVSSRTKHERPVWRLNVHEDGTSTLRPSVNRMRGCRTHFWFRRGRVFWCSNQSNSLWKDIRLLLRGDWSELSEYAIQNSSRYRPRPINGSSVHLRQLHSRSTRLAESFDSYLSAEHDAFQILRSFCALVLRKLHKPSDAAVHARAKGNLGRQYLRACMATGDVWRFFGGRLTITHGLRST